MESFRKCVVAALASLLCLVLFGCVLPGARISIGPGGPIGTGPVGAGVNSAGIDQTIPVESVPPPGRKGSHPLTVLDLEEATAFIAGQYWNGDLWLTRKLDLRVDGSFTYTQDGAILNPGNAVWTGVDKLGQEVVWRLEGRWFFASERNYILRLEVDRAHLDSGREFGEGAHLEIQVERLGSPHSLVIDPLKTLGPHTATAKDRVFIKKVRLRPLDHPVLPATMVKPRDEARWDVDYRLTVLGMHLVPWQTEVDGPFIQ